MHFIREEQLPSFIVIIAHIVNANQLAQLNL